MVHSYHIDLDAILIEAVFDGGDKGIAGDFPIAGDLQDFEFEFKEFFDGFNELDDVFDGDVEMVHFEFEDIHVSVFQQNIADVFDVL